MAQLVQLVFLSVNFTKPKREGSEFKNQVQSVNYHTFE